jgi:hypothetical protein
MNEYQKKKLQAQVEQNFADKPAVKAAYEERKEAQAKKRRMQQTISNLQRRDTIAQAQGTTWRPRGNSRYGKTPRSAKKEMTPIERTYVELEEIQTRLRADPDNDALYNEMMNKSREAESVFKQMLIDEGHWNAGERAS